MARQLGLGPSSDSSTDPASEGEERNLGRDAGQNSSSSSVSVEQKSGSISESVELQSTSLSEDEKANLGGGSGGEEVGPPFSRDLGVGLALRRRCLSSRCCRGHFSCAAFVCCCCLSSFDALRPLPPLLSFEEGRLTLSPCDAGLAPLRDSELLAVLSSERLRKSLTSFLIWVYAAALRLITWIPT